MSERNSPTGALPISPEDAHEYQQQNNGSVITGSFMNLPRDFHVQLISYLDYRAIQMLRATNSCFHKLPTESQIARSREDYIEALLKEEIEEAGSSEAENDSTSADSRASNLTNNDDILPCYTCLRRRHISHFAKTQTSRRRTKGHSHAHMRFCTDCALRDERWAPGVVLPFQHCPAIYCRRCRDIKPPPVNPWLRRFRLCENCRLRTGLPDAHMSKKGPYANVKKEAEALVAQFYEENGNAKKSVPEGMWEKLEVSLGMLSVDEKSLESS